METINIVQGGQPQPPAVLIFGNSHNYFFPSVWHVPRVPIIAFTHYEIRDFPPNCAELIRGLPAASPPTLLLASVSTPGGGGSDSPSGRQSRPVHVSENFFYGVGELRIDLASEENIAK